ncbi:MAG: hypothetical protein ACREPR_10155 [Brasilonema sp.]
MEGIKAAKIALIDRFSNNQQKLANALGVSRQPVNRFFNRKPVDSSLFVQICEKLGLKWQEVADFLQSEVEESLQNSDIITSTTGSGTTPNRVCRILITFSRFVSIIPSSFASLSILVTYRIFCTSS